ncbi:ABC transporter permease [Microbacterium horticulturae]|uniref:ABC transporter permease n=1 Tax=Microbacterium horticulturae TaxID=3028316 RepID=A0ABY8BVI7_9MICO|nr:ABC transporter permease [Microbacterium sp. KACC 23027]WEG07857.1 ABC transporter permease [Microbacterium sp. KACC 23027]
MPRPAAPGFAALAQGPDLDRGRAMRGRGAAARRGARTGTARPSAWARWRADLRLAGRQVRRTKGSSALVVALVALPVLALSGGVVFADSHMSTPAQRADMALGQGQSWVGIAGGADPSRMQAVDDPNWADVDVDDNGDPIHEQGPAPTDVAGAVPAGTRTIEVTQYGSVSVNTAGGIGQVEAVTGPAWDPVLTGRYVTLDGSAPETGAQAMVSPGLLKRLGASIGGTVTLTDSDRTFTITGTLRERDREPSDDVIFLPAAASGLVQGGVPGWFVPDWQPDYAQLQQLNHDGYVALARDLAVNPPAGATVANGTDSSWFWVGVTIATIAAAFGGYLVVLLAGAAFAVAARRQERSLAMAVSVGASRSDVFRIVVLQGTVLGAVGGVLGSAVGVGLGFALLAVTDHGVAGSFWGHWSYDVPWLVIVGVVVFAILVGTISAIAPARAATHGDPLAALRGSRRPVTLNVRRPLWALLVMAVGLIASIGGALGTAALDRATNADPTGQLHATLIIAAILGPLVFQIGLIVAGHFTLAQVAKVLSRWGLAARIAGRDAAANPSRVVPAFAVIAACVFVAAFSISVVGMTARETNDNYSWEGHPGTVAVGMWGDDAATHPDDFVEAARHVVAGTGATKTATVWTTAQPVTDDDGNPIDPDAPEWTLTTPTGHANDPSFVYDAGGQVAVLSPDDLETVLGPVPAAARDAFRDGTALSIAKFPNLDDDSEVTVSMWKSASLTDFRQQAYSQSPPPAASLPSPISTTSIPMMRASLQYPQGSMQLVISTATAKRLGMALQPQTLYALYPKAPSTSVVDGITAAVANTRIGSNGVLNVQVEKGPASFDPVLWLIVAAAMVLVFGAGSVCLGLARFERRPDDATLAAVGAGGRIRRGIGAWQAVTIVGIGTVVGTVSGTISAWALTKASNGLYSFAATPWLWLAITAFGLPLVMAAASWLIPPRAPDLTRRTAIA